MQPIVNDFFCGCGGMGVGFLNAGYKIAGAWDFDKYAVQSYDHNVGHHVKQADIKEMTWQDVPFAHVWAFGFPCQDLSVAGKQAGLLLKCQDCDSDFAIDPSNFTGQTTCPNCGSKNYKAASRSGCFYEIMRLIDETREHAPNSLPAVLVAENVKGLTPYIPVLTAELKQRGYIAHVKLYNSKFWNVAQNRERYYIAATRDDLPDVLQMPAQNEDPENVPKLSLFLDDNVPERFYIPNEKAQKIIEQALKRLETLGKVHATITPDRIEKRQNGRRAKDDEDPMFTLTAQDLHGVIIQTEEDDENGVIVSEICTETGLLDPNGCGKTLRVGGGGVVDQEAQLPAHTVEHIGVTVTDYATKLQKFTDTANCLQARDSKGFGRQGMTAVIELSKEDENAKDCLPVEVAYNQNNRNAGGFADSDVKRYLNEEVFNSLPEELRNVIAEVERKQENGESSLCRLFLPTESELFGDCCYSEDDTYSQIEYYKDRRNRIKCNRKGGSPDWYWTASVRSGTSTTCVYVNHDGGSIIWNASGELCVPVCFVIQ